MRGIYSKIYYLYSKIKGTLCLQKILIFILFLLFLSLTWIYYSFIKATTLTFKKVESAEIQNVKNLSFLVEKNLNFNLKEKKILNKHFSIKKAVYLFEKNKNMLDRFNNFLSLYINKGVRYVYIIYKDRKGAYRYLLDGSLPLSERGKLNQVFVPVNINLWKKCFKTKKDVYGTQNKNKVLGLWITYLHPLIYNGRIQCVLALDVSSYTYNRLKNVLKPIKSYLKYMIIFTLLTILCIFLETILLIKEQKERRTDPLTGLFNRSYLKEIEKNLDLKQIAVAIIDVDFFKNINDTYGHDYGDLALKNLAKKLMLYTRNCDIIIRYGGEEFLIIFKNYNGYVSKQDIKSIVQAVKRIQKTISKKPTRLKNIEIQFTISAGIDPFTFKRQSLSESITMADRALYKAKETGRNRVVVSRFNNKNV